MATSRPTLSARRTWTSAPLAFWTIRAGSVFLPNVTPRRQKRDPGRVAEERAGAVDTAWRARAGSSAICAADYPKWGRPNKGNHLGNARQRQPLHTRSCRTRWLWFLMQSDSRGRPAMRSHRCHFELDRQDCNAAPGQICGIADLAYFEEG